MVFSPYRMILSLCLLSPLLLGCVERTVPTEETAQAEPTVEPASPATVPGKGQESIPEEPSNLDIGIRAPALHIAEWVKGKSVEEYQPGKIYVVEFWATTCPPCKTSMPHISKLQETYGKEVTFVGVTRESVEIVQAFLQLPVDAALAGLGDTWNDLMRYTVAVDDDAATHAAFMYAAEESGIPTAFVVGFDGKIEWIGHPMGIDEPLQQIVARSWDRDAALAKRTEEKRKEEQWPA